MPFILAHPVVMTRYIENIDALFSILIYRIVSYRQKISKFSIHCNIFQKNAIFSTYRNILRQTFIFLLPHGQNNDNKSRKQQTNQSKLTIQRHLRQCLVNQVH